MKVKNPIYIVSINFNIFYFCRQDNNEFCLLFSRSHGIFTIRISQKENSTSKMGVTATITLADLAGKTMAHFLPHLLTMTLIKYTVYFLLF